MKETTCNWDRILPLYEYAPTVVEYPEMGVNIQFTVSYRVHCAVCGKYTEFYTTAPYSSKHDGDAICGECIDKLFEEKDNV